MVICRMMDEKTNPAPGPASDGKDMLIVFSIFTLVFILIDRLAVWPADPTAGFWLAAVAVVVVTTAVEALYFRRGLAATFRFLGFGVPDRRTLAVTFAIGAAMLLYFPVYARITGAGISMPEHAWWKLSGIIALHGLAEEVLFRGFLFRHLRAGRSFHRATWLSLAVFAVAHVYLFTYMPLPVAAFATLLALAIAFPLAYLFERGNNTVWAPALLHSMVHAVTFFRISEPHAATAGIIWMCLWTAAALLLYFFRAPLFGPNTKQ